MAVLPIPNPNPRPNGGNEASGAALAMESYSACVYSSFLNFSTPPSLSEDGKAQGRWETKNHPETAGLVMCML